MISINKKKKILIGVILLILIAVLLLNKKEKSDVTDGEYDIFGMTKASNFFKAKQLFKDDELVRVD